MIKVKLHRAMADRDVRTQKQLVDMTGITPNTISAIYNGEIKAIRLDTLDKLCVILNCKVGDLLEHVDADADPQ